MSKRGKKILALALASALLSVSGCGGETVDKVEKMPQDSEQTGETADLETSYSTGKEMVESAPQHVSVHDPSIFREEDENGNVTYYAFGTHITTAKSDNLVDWTVFTNGYQAKENTHYGDLSENLKESFAWAGEDDSDCKGGLRGVGTGRCI